MAQTRYLLLLTAGLLGGCAHNLIAGTTIRDTDENRQVIGILTKMHVALETLDADALTKLVSPKYFEDMGTSDPSDDYGYDQLVNKVLPDSLQVAKQFSIDMEIQAVWVDGETAHADVRYNSRAELKLPAGSIWDSHQEFNRVRLSRIDGQWLIISGL